MYLTFPAFPAGEVSPMLEGRSDLPALKMALRLARNVIPQRLGPLLQRPGFMYRGLTEYQGAQRCRLIPFVVSSAVAYVIEAGPNTFRFWRDNSLLLTTADNVGRPGVISGLGDPLLISTPYDAGTLNALQFCSANDVMWICHKNYPVAKLIRYAEDEFEFADMTFVFPPLRDINVEEITLAASGTLTVGGAVTLTAAGGDVFTADNIGGYYGLDHRRETPYAEISLSTGSSTAQASLNWTGNAVAGETTTIGTGTNQRIYTWDGEGPYGLAVGGTTQISVTTLEAALNGTTDAGVNPGTVAHPSVIAADLGSFTTGVYATGTLTCTDNDLEAGSSPDKVLTGSGGSLRTYRFKNTINGASPAYDVKIGASIAASLLNWAKAVNASGIAGTDYGIGTLVNPDVSANETIVGNTVVVTSLVIGLAGNAIQLDVDDTSRLSWGSTTLTGGATAGTNKLQVSARIQGEAGNDIAIAESMTNATWNPTGFLTGGANNTSYDPSNPSAVIPTVRVNGTWEVYTLGRWYGLLTLQQQRSTGEWEVVRTWESQNDREVNTTGQVDGEKLMRLIFVGSGIADDDAPARAVLTAIDAIVHGLVLITGVTSATVATGTVVKAIWSTDPTYIWAEGSWSERRGYPAAVVLHQQRLTFGHRARLIGSQTGGFDNFERTELADASYQYELVAIVSCNIVALHSQSGLTILADNSEWLADGGTDGSVITPSNVRIQKLTEYGASESTSQIVGSNVIFIQSGGWIANEYLFQWANQDYTAVDLSELADHLTRDGLLQIAFAPNPHSLIYFVTKRGALLSLSYRRQAGGADQGGMLAWSKLSTPDDSGVDGGWFESVCVVPASNELSDVFVIVRRLLPDGSYVRTLESYDESYWDYLNGDSAASLSSLVVLDGSITASVILASPSVSGLDHLEGLTVSVLLNGMIHPDRVVTGGEIQIDPAQLPASSTSIAVVGLAPLAQIQPWFATPSFKDGGGDGRTFRVAKLNTRFYLSGAAQYADDNDGAPFYDVIFRMATDIVGVPVPLRTRLIKSDLGGGHQSETRFIYRNRSPLPMNILGLTAELVVNSA